MGNLAYNSPYSTFLNKHWINNHNSKLNSLSRVENAPKSGKKLVRKPSGFNAFTREFLQQEQKGGSAVVFRTIGEKWRGLPESAKDSYRKKAGSNFSVSLPSPDKRAKKTINNIMKEVAELEILGGHAVALCAYDGALYHGAAGVGETVLKTTIVETFVSHLRCSQEKKQEVSVKTLQELFNSKYSELVHREGSKMPYSKIVQMGIKFKDLKSELLAEIGAYPKKPSLYGSAQRRKLWLTRHEWSFSVSLSAAPSEVDLSSTQAVTVPTNVASSRSHTATPNIQLSISGTINSSTCQVNVPAYVHASACEVTAPVSVHPPTSHTIRPPVSVHPPPSHTITAPVSVHPPPSHTITAPVSVHSLPSHTITAPVSVHSPPSHTITAPVSVHPSTSHTITVPVSVHPPPSHTIRPPVSVHPPTSHTITAPVSVHPPPSHTIRPPVSVHPPTSHTTTFPVSVPVSTLSTQSLHSTPSSAGFLISKDTELGMLTSTADPTVHAVSVLSPRTQIHGHSISPGNVVVEVRKVMTPGLRPLCHSAFDEGEPVSVGGFYEWPFSHLTFMQDVVRR